MNYWTAASGIVDAFVQEERTSVPLQLTIRTLEAVLPAGPLRVVDIGGGNAAVAVRLAATRHEVVAQDIVPHLIALGEQRLAKSPPAIHDLACYDRGVVGRRRRGRRWIARLSRTRRHC